MELLLGVIRRMNNSEYDVVYAKDDYIMPNGIFPDWLITSAEFATMLVAFIGMVIALRYAILFNADRKNLTGEQRKTSTKLQHLFLSDFGVYLVTFVMGFALYFNMPNLVKFDVIIRPFALLLNVSISILFFKHIKKARQINKDK